jgi:hypothetical protein
MKMTVTQFIKKHCELHSTEVTYDEWSKSFYLRHFSDRTSRGIYFFTVGDDVLKVGMADGIRGFYDRFSKYNCNQASSFEKGNASATSMYYAMQEVYKKYGKRVKMQVWVHKMDNELENYHGFTVPSSKIRGFEYAMSLRAREEGHSMLLSKQN